MAVVLRHNFSDFSDGTLLSDTVDEVQLIGPSWATPLTINNGAIQDLNTYPSRAVLVDFGPTAPRRFKFVGRNHTSLTVAAKQESDGYISTVWIEVFLDTPSNASPYYRIGVGQSTLSVDGAYGGIRYPAIYNLGFRQAPGATVDDLITVEARIDGNKMRVWVQSNQVTNFNLPVTDNAFDISGMEDATWFGWGLGGSEIAGTVLTAVARDEVDLLSITKVTKYRTSPTGSGLSVLVNCNTPGTTILHADVIDEDGEIVATGSASLSGQTATIRTSEIDPAFAGQPLRVFVYSDIASEDQTDEYLTQGPFTATYRPAKLGMNVNFFTWYLPGGSTRDLSHNLQFFAPANSGSYPDYPGFIDEQTKAKVGICPSGWPTKFHDDDPDQRMGFTPHWFPDASQSGTYEMDWSQQPLLRPGLEWRGSPTKSLTLDFYGPGRHKLVIGPPDPTAHAGHEYGGDPDLWIIWISQTHFDPAMISAFVDPATLPGGDWQMTIRKVDEPFTSYWTNELATWDRTFGGIGHRYMTSYHTNESYPESQTFDFRDEAIWTSDKRTLPTGNWAKYPFGESGYPWEYMFSRARASKGYVWLSLHRATDPQYVTDLINFAKTNYPDIDLIVEYSNELWNFGFAQSTWCSILGFEAGLGDLSAVYGQRLNITVPLALGEERYEGAPQYRYEDFPLSTNYPVGYRARWFSDIWVRVGPQGMVPPEYEGSGWVREQSTALATKRYISERVRVLADAMADASGPDLYGSRYKFVVGNYQNNADWCDEILTWGPDGDPLGGHIHGVATGCYFALEAANASDLSDGTERPHPALAYPTGSAERHTAILALMREDMELQLSGWQAFHTHIGQLNSTYGWDLEGMGYEVGHHLLIQPPGNLQYPLPQKYWDWFVDLQSVLDSAGMREMMRDFLNALITEAGGHICFFQDFDSKFGNHTRGGIYAFGISDGPTDLASARRQGIIDAMKDQAIYYDPELDPELVVRARRRAPQLLHRSAVH